MSQRKTVPCPLGNQCPSGGKHYPDSSIYSEHMRLSNGKSNPNSGRTQEQERERLFNPMADWGLGKRGDNMRELEPNLNNSILYRGLNKFLTSAFSLFQ